MPPPADGCVVARVGELLCLLGDPTTALAYTAEDGPAAQYIVCSGHIHATRVRGVATAALQQGKGGSAEVAALLEQSLASAVEAGYFMPQVVRLPSPSWKSGDCIGSQARGVDTLGCITHGCRGLCVVQLSLLLMPPRAMEPITGPRTEIVDRHRCRQPLPRLPPAITRVAAPRVAFRYRRCRLCWCAAGSAPRRAKCGLGLVFESSVSRESMRTKLFG